MRLAEKLLAVLKQLVRWLVEGHKVRVGGALSEGERAAAIMLAASSGMLPGVPRSTAYSQAGVVLRIAEEERRRARA
ncbi:MAG: hypothetical protein J7L75_06945, partial [Thermoproteales archaeon]|nr:hypothetical protein [Thermoproteales archaeon]